MTTEFTDQPIDQPVEQPIDTGSDSPSELRTTLSELYDSMDDGTTTETSDDLFGEGEETTGETETGETGTETVEAGETTGEAQQPELPEQLQQEIDFLRGEATISQNFRAVIEPHMEFLQAADINPYEHVSEMLNMSRTLASGTPEQKAELVASLYEMFDVDLDLLDAALTKIVNRPEPTAEEKLLAKLETIEARLNGQSTQTPQKTEQRVNTETVVDTQTQAQLQAELQQFSKTVPHFELVRADMAMLMGAGRANTLQEAYDMACRISPQVAQLNAQKAQQVSTAAKTGLKGSSAPSKPVKPHGNSSLRNVLEQLYDDMDD